MQDKSTHRFSVLIVAMYLTMALGLSVVTATVENTNSQQVAEAPQDSASSTHTPTPKRDTIVSEKPTIRDYAKTWMLINHDGHYSEWLCMDEIIHRESRWIPNLYNKQGSGAYGLGQVKGSDKYTKGKPLLQFKVALRYAIHKHGTPCNALDFHNDNGWY